MRPKVYFKTFGCRTNIYDTQIMIENLHEYDITEDENNADYIVINSCTVTNGADTNARGYIHSIKRKNEKAKILFTGCGVRSKGEELYDEDKVFGVFGQSEKEKINTILKSDARFFELGDLKHVDKTIVEEFVGKSRAFIKVQEGCSFRCSYCIIPYVRGNSRSMDEAIILEQVRKLAANGFGEFILTGTNVGSYGQKTNSSLANLMKQMSEIFGVKRIRLGSVEPVHITDEFKEILHEPWMAKQLHVAIQHSHDEMLKIMNRRNCMHEDIKLFEYLAQEGFAIGTDYIVGHPGESEKIWKEAMQNIEHYPLTHIHAFTYSKRDNTPSAKMKEDVRGDVAKARLKELTTIIDEKNYQFRKAVKEPLKVLVENGKGLSYSGLDQYFNRITINSETNLKGSWLSLDDYEVKKEANHAYYEEK